MTTAALVLALAVLAGLAWMQVLLISGRPIGHYAWGGQHRVLPLQLRRAAGGAILLYVGFAVLLLSRAGVLPGGETRLVVVATWVLAVYCALSVVLNAMSRSRHERIVQIPLSILLTVSVFTIATT